MSYSELGSAAEYERGADYDVEAHNAHSADSPEADNESDVSSVLSNNERWSNVDSDLSETPENPPSPHPFSNCDYILTDYHPHSGRNHTFHTLSDYGRQRSSELPPDKEPWRPFRTRLDFEICELALESYLNKKQIKKLITLINKAVIAGPGNEREGFTISSVDEVERLWELTTKQHVQFQQVEVTVMYKNVPISYPFKYRDPWEWILDMVKNPQLAPNIAWEAQRVFRWDHISQRFERFVDEPWTAEAFWEAQSKLPQGATPIALILYADKAKLSTFSTAKGYPIVARLGNLSTNIRNSDGVGGGRVVGWLPIVHEDTKETGKTSFTNFKNAVWHESFLKFLETVIETDEVGKWVKCGDSISRWLFVIILIFSADFEEYTTVSLTRGSKAKFPCPVCLVPQDELSNVTTLFPLRHQLDMKEIVMNAMAPGVLATEREKQLKSFGLRPVYNAFWKLAKSDIYHTISYDTLHSDDNGLWEDHFFVQFKQLVADRDSISRIDSQFDRVPRWPGLNHFKSVMNISFNDGSKNRDISSLFIFAATCVLGHDRKTAGYQLLKCLRPYLNVRMYAEFELHTHTTVLNGRKELKKFGMEIAVHEDAPNIQVKSWNFPKLHLRQHLFDDIVNKGVARNFSTKPNERMHGPIRKSYHRRTNFKNFGDQVLMADEMTVASSFIRSNLDMLDLWNTPKDDESDENYASVRKLSVPDKAPISFQDLENFYTNNHSFHRFQIRFQNWLSIFLRQYQVMVPNQDSIRFKKEDLIVCYKALKVQYTCLSDWKIKSNNLHCREEFHGHPRYDCILVHADPPYFARLKLLFTCSVNGSTYPFAYIQPFIPVYKHQNRPLRDKDLHLLRLRATLSVDSTEFISIHSILRGAVLIPSGESGVYKDDYFLYDLLDPDMFLRARSESEKISERCVSCY
ncbi:hypothetical protein AGABI1DRAFT_45660 [Agaricus bisporus var. burnettii JB137-S8]|uniref:Uncharacterized protein n=1 Tax=Agaricus bisporus var. burnettii (strain JB137-S8 / ATCC MYA-4627 / FGSC 10392) TaxID=597362 RepID=K5VNB3_AGABU|nr:uncharacterized protein AGABI1DRAFT_45660 [Agaricus bisporus var. burnettii JB137-S8]EKM75949.1 hypothetical protein AGABI1DRAFT_45660 [Agaricus bisporus var. burnettii JB137-S8]